MVPSSLSSLEKGLFLIWISNEITMINLHRVAAHRWPNTIQQKEMIRVLYISCKIENKIEKLYKLPKQTKKFQHCIECYILSWYLWPIGWSAERIGSGQSVGLHVFADSSLKSAADSSFKLQAPVTPNKLKLLLGWGKMTHFGCLIHC